MTLLDRHRLRIAGRVEVPPAMLSRWPGACVVVVIEACMVPTLVQGDMLLVAPTAPLQAGGLVLITEHSRRQSVKQLVDVPPLGGLEAGYMVRTKQHANPRLTFTWKPRTILALHAVVGLSRRGLEVMQPLAGYLDQMGAAA